MAVNAFVRLRLCFIYCILRIISDVSEICYCATKGKNMQIKKTILSRALLLGIGTAGLSQGAFAQQAAHAPQPGRDAGGRNKRRAL